jgi:hypothetical protein
LEMVPTSSGGPHMLAGGQVWDAGWGAAARASRQGASVGHPGASHVQFVTSDCRLLTKQ